MSVNCKNEETTNVSIDDIIKRLSKRVSCEIYTDKKLQSKGASSEYRDYSGQNTASAGHWDRMLKQWTTELINTTAIS